MTSGIPAAVLAAAGYALLETAFFARRNLLLPWEGRHVFLVLIFLAMHLVVALAALGLARVLTRRFVPSLSRTFPPFAPVAVLIAIQAVTAYRERAGSLPRDLAGTAITLGIVVGLLGAAALAAWAFRKRPAHSARVATAIAAGLVAAGTLRMATARAPGSETAVTPRPAEDRLAAAPTGQRVFVFGFDGATWDVLDPMIRDGRLPNLAALAARGRTFDVETIQPTFSPVIWTSIATGKNRFQHGVHDVVQTVLPGGVRLPRSMRRTAFLTKTTGVPFRLLDQRRLLPMAPYRSSEVRSTSVFEAASEAGLSTSLVEWYVTWPAIPLSGVTISDRFHLQGDGPPKPGLTYPPELAELLADRVVTGEDVPVERVTELADVGDLGAAEAAEWADRHRGFVREMRLNLARDLTTRNVAVDLLARDRDWRLFGVYFRAVDLSHHLTWRFYRAAASGAEVGVDEETRQLQSVVTRYHELMDRIVGEVLALVPEDAAIVLLSDHGFEDVYDHRRAPDGVAILAGGPFVPSPQRGRLSIYDIAPTIAVLLGLPVAEDLVDPPRTDLLSREFLDAWPPRSVSTWEHLGRPRGSDAPVDAADAEEVERLRALGYLQ